MTLRSTQPFIRDRLTWLAYAMLACVAFSQSTLGPAMPFLRDELALTYTQGGLLPAAAAAGIIAAGLFGDRLAQRLGRRFLFWGGAAGLTAATLSLGLNLGFPSALASAAGVGVCSAVALTMIQAILADRHGERRAIAFTESNVGASLSSGLPPACIGALVQAGLGWQGALFLPVALLALLALRFRSTPIPEAAHESGAHTQGKLPPVFWAYWAVMLLVVAIEMCLLVWSADFLRSVAGLSDSAAVTALSVFAVAMVLGRAAGSGLSRRWPVKVLMLLALGVTLLGFPIFWLARTAWLNVAGLFLTGLGVANLYPFTLSIAVGLAPELANRASARASLAVGVALLTAPLLLGWAADRFTLPTAFGLEVALILAAMGMALWSGRQRQQRIL
jgi:predicted MFS family arabinose efflux permease